MLNTSYRTDFDLSSEDGYRGNIYPDGTFSLGFDSQSRRERKQQEISRQYEQSRKRSFLPSAPSDIPGEYREVSPYEEEAFSSVRIEDIETAKAEPERYLLNLTKGVISRNRKGLTGLTNNGGRTIKQSAFILQERYGSQRLSFNTVTIPPLLDCDRELLAENWGEFQRRLFEEYRRELARVSKDSLSIISVTEIQSKRYAATGDLYLHLHFVCVGKSASGRYYICPNWFRELVKRCIVNLLTSLSNDALFDPTLIRWTNCVKMEVVRSNAAGYLSKYMAKGKKSLGYVKEEDEKFLPYQWWYVTRLLKQTVRRFTVPLDRTDCATFMSRLAAYQDMGGLLNIYVGTVKLDYCEIPFIVGKLRGDIASDFTCLYLLEILDI